MEDELNPILVKTKDGSASLFVDTFDQHYHSIHGALQESMHVFIHAGLEERMHNLSRISILEMGMGTGLNVLLTYLLTQKKGIKLRYTALEAYPLSLETVKTLEYGKLVEDPDAAHAIETIHKAKWDRWVSMSEEFDLYKFRGKIEDYVAEAGTFDLIYYDAFAPSAQPELWEESIFESLFEWTKQGGILVTYCVKGVVKRRMQYAGFTIEKLPGPPGKREMLRAIKA